MKKLSPHSPIILNNLTCAYCGMAFNKNSTKEHVVARKFIPKGKLDKNWNLILNACRDCNNQKSRLEDEISAISMQPNSYGEFANQDEKLISEAVRKGKGSFSSRTGRAIINSQEKFKIETTHPSGVKFKFDLISPPQVEENRIYELARLQIMAFFYYLTYQENTNKGYFWKGGFYPINYCHKNNWDNNFQVSFADKIKSWDFRWHGVTADGYFKSSIRKHPSQKCWAWALEWNMNYRIIGFFGDKNVAEKNIFSLYHP